MDIFLVYRNTKMPFAEILSVLWINLKQYKVTHYRCVDEVIMHFFFTAFLYLPKYLSIFPVSFPAL